MKKIIFIFTVILSISCQKEEEVLIEQETKISLISIVPEISGNCSNDGFKIETGIDTDNNGVLDINEVQSTSYICNGNNGENGLNSLINIIQEPIGENCNNGGFKIETGIDIDKSRVLENIEIQSINYICNAGDGENGLNSLINIVDEEIGENCTNGGFKIETGIDTDINGILDNNEVQEINYICNQYSDINTQYNIEGILTYGQSLAVTVGASDKSGDFKNSLSFIGGNSVVESIDISSFVEIKNNTNISYAPVMASTLAALSLIESENNLDINQLEYQYLPLTGGVAGAPISRMNKGTTAYQNVLDAITSAKSLADQQGKTFAWRVINWVQGEANRFDTKQEYYDKVELLFNNFNSDIKSITGQSEDIIFITHQTSPWLGRDLNRVLPHPDINVQEAQLQLANDKPNVFMDGGSYQFAYADFFHPTDRAVVGLKQGVVLKRILNDGRDWITFQPISHEVVADDTKYRIYLKFDVPVKPMRFDISADLWHNPNGKQPNYGFELLENGIEKQISEPFITLGNTVVLTTDTDPTGMFIRYAVNGHDGGGNLCDNQNIIIRNKQTDYVIDNFAVGFSEYLID